MTDRDGTAVDVESISVEPELAGARDRLRGERLVQLEEIDLFERSPNSAGAKRSGASSTPRRSTGRSISRCSSATSTRSSPRVPGGIGVIHPVRVLVRLRPKIHDPQGEAIRRALGVAGVSGVESVRQGEGVRPRDRGPVPGCSGGEGARPGRARPREPGARGFRGRSRTALMARRRFAVLVFPGTNCEGDVLHAIRAVTGQDAELVWHRQGSLDGFRRGGASRRLRPRGLPPRRRSRAVLPGDDAALRDGGGRAGGRRDLQRLPDPPGGGDAPRSDAAEPLAHLCVPRGVGPRRGPRFAADRGACGGGRRSASRWATPRGTSISTTGSWTRSRPGAR